MKKKLGMLQALCLATAFMLSFNAAAQVTQQQATLQSDIKQVQQLRQQVKL